MTTEQLKIAVKAQRRPEINAMLKKYNAGASFQPIMKRLQAIVNDVALKDGATRKQAHDAFMDLFEELF